MRTTLKRGMGRAATVNGNGRAVLPPPVLEPMRRYKAPRAAAALGARHRRQGLRLVPARARRRRHRARRRRLSLRPRDAERDRAAHAGGQGDGEAPQGAADRVAAGDGADHRLRRARRQRGLRPGRLALRHGHARSRGPDEQHAVAALVPARPPGADLLRCGRPRSAPTGSTRPGRPARRARPTGRSRRCRS